MLAFSEFVHYLSLLDVAVLKITSLVFFSGHDTVNILRRNHITDTTHSFCVRNLTDKTSRHGHIVKHALLYFRQIYTDIPLCSRAK